MNISFWGGGDVVFARWGCLSPLRVPGDVPGRAEVGAPSELSRSPLVWPPGRGGEKGLCLVLSPDQPVTTGPGSVSAVKGRKRPHLSRCISGVQGTGSFPLSASGRLITGVSDWKSKPESPWPCSPWPCSLWPLREGDASFACVSRLGHRGSLELCLNPPENRGKLTEVTFPLWPTKLTSYC